MDHYTETESNSKTISVSDKSNKSLLRFHLIHLSKQRLHSNILFSLFIQVHFGFSVVAKMLLTAEEKLPAVGNNFWLFLTETSLQTNRGSERTKT